MIQRKLKPCKTCKELRYIFSHRNCKDCSRLLKISGKPKFTPLVQTENGKAAKPFRIYRTKEIKKVSTRQQKLNQAYAAQRKVYLTSNPYCKAMIYSDTLMCTGFATDIHHKRGRGEYLLDERTWLPVCRNCHQFIEIHPEWSKEKGFSESRLEKR